MPTIVQRLRSIRSTAEYVALVDNATKEERAEIRAALLGWQRDAKDCETFYRRAAQVDLAMAIAGAFGFLFAAAQVFAIACR
jgi:hypothetical protein